jgi:hypothetical protein
VPGLIVLSDAATGQRRLTELHWSMRVTLALDRRTSA